MTTLPPTAADMHAESRSRLAAALLAAGAFVFCLTFWAYDADGTMDVFDSITYAVTAETTPWGSIIAHHPLFHLLVLPILQVTRALGCAQPGAVAVRVLSGAGGAMIMWLLVRMAGRARLAAGVACALLVATTRIFVCEGASGENLLPACAAALWVFDRASRPKSKLVTVGIGLFFALLLRQDNLVAVPALLFLLARAHTWRRLVVFVAAVGAAAFLFYAALYCVLREAPGEVLGPHPKLTSWLLGYAERTLKYHHFNAGTLMDYTSTLMNGLFGFRWGFDPSPAHTAVGVGWMAAVGVAAWLVRGGPIDRRLVAAWALALAARWCFYAWFEPLNAEWHVLTIVAFAAVVARGARDESAAAARSTMRGGLVVLALLIVAALFLAWPTLVRLRATRLADAVAAACKDAGPNAYVICVDFSVGGACDVLRIPHELAGAGDPVTAAAKFLKAAETADRPLLLISDRFVQGAHPYALNGGALLPLAVLDTFRPGPGIRTFSAEGHPFALIAGPASRPEAATRH